MGSGIFQIPIEFNGTVTPFLYEMRESLVNRGPLNALISTRLSELTKAYLRGVAPVNHATANRLGAEPTGHFEKSARAVSATADNFGAYIKIASPGFSRAFRKVTIKPTRAKALTIPVHASSYGKRAGDFELDWKPVSTDGDGSKKKGAKNNNFAGVLVDPEGTTLFILLRSVTIPQKRNILPSDRAFLLTAERAAQEYFDTVEGEEESGTFGGDN